MLDLDVCSLVRWLLCSWGATDTSRGINTAVEGGRAGLIAVEPLCLGLRPSISLPEDQKSSQGLIAATGSLSQAGQPGATPDTQQLGRLPNSLPPQTTPAV